MDGVVATYENATASVLNGVLRIRLHAGPPAGILMRSWNFPISNIRAWGPEEREGQHGVLLPGIFSDSTAPGN